MTANNLHKIIHRGYTLLRVREGKGKEGKGRKKKKRHTFIILVLYHTNPSAYASEKMWDFVVF